MARSPTNSAAIQLERNGIRRDAAETYRLRHQKMQVRPFGLPDTSEFHLYAESIRKDGLIWNSEELASDPEGRYSQKDLEPLRQSS
jgi:hypothetical protein